jgi:hypothetical protein
VALGAEEMACEFLRLTGDVAPQQMEAGLFLEVGQFT